MKRSHSNAFKSQEDKIVRGGEYLRNKKQHHNKVAATCTNSNGVSTIPPPRGFPYRVPLVYMDWAYDHIRTAEICLAFCDTSNFAYMHIDSQGDMFCTPTQNGSNTFQVNHPIESPGLFADLQHTVVYGCFVTMKGGDHYPLFCVEHIVMWKQTPITSSNTINAERLQLLFDFMQITQQRHEYTVTRFSIPDIVPASAVFSSATSSSLNTNNNLKYPVRFYQCIMLDRSYTLIKKPESRSQQEHTAQILLHCHGNNIDHKEQDKDKEQDKKQRKDQNKDMDKDKEQEQEQGAHKRRPFYVEPVNISTGIYKLYKHANDEKSIGYAFLATIHQCHELARKFHHKMGSTHIYKYGHQSEESDDDNMLQQQPTNKCNDNHHHPSRMHLIFKWNTLFRAWEPIV